MMDRPKEQITRELQDVDLVTNGYKISSLRDTTYHPRTKRETLDKLELPFADDMACGL